MSRLFISRLASAVSSHILILASICPYSGSSLNLWLLSRKMAQLLVFSQIAAAAAVELEYSTSFSAQMGLSWWKSPEKTMETPPYTMSCRPVSFFSCLSSFAMLLVVKNDISSMMSIRTPSLHNMALISSVSPSCLGELHCVL